MNRILSIVSAGILALLAVGSGAPAATAASQQITKANCEAQGGTYRVSKGETLERHVVVPKGTRICTIQVFSSHETTTGLVGSTQPDENGTYYRGTAHRETDYRVTTYLIQRPNEPAVTFTQYASTARVITDSCYRVDSANQPNETVTQVDNSICESRISNYALP